MRKWMAVLAFIVLTGCSSREAAPVTRAGAEVKPIMDVKESPDNQLVKVTKDQVYQGNLILVNKDHGIRTKSVRTDVVNLFQHKELRTGYSLLDNTVRLSEGVAQAMMDLVQAAGKEKINHFMVSSGYRTQEEQTALYREKGSDYALPAGYSEHNTGLALDIGSTLGEMSQAPEGKWLRNHAWQYGFVLRYPKDKASVTGIQYEPWHFRYVGLPHSAIMQDMDLTLEEYWDYVKQQKNLKTTVDGRNYELHYYPVTSNTTIRVPAGQHYEISGDNMGGILVTTYPG
jgi:zinc D-Ala-D-Ala carboxypeptidase